jgi:hypothetical protein
MDLVSLVLGVTLLLVLVVVVAMMLRSRWWLAPLTSPLFERAYFMALGAFLATGVVTAAFQSGIPVPGAIGYGFAGLLLGVAGFAKWRSDRAPSLEATA